MTTLFVNKAQALLQQIKDTVALLRRSPIEFIVVLAAVALFAVAAGLSIPKLIADSFDFILTGVIGEAWVARLKPALPGILVLMGSVLLAWVVWRFWRRPVSTPPPASTQVRAAAIKGPMAFTEQDDALFRRLGRERELERLVGLVRDDQSGLAVVMGESGAGKTSLLRAGLSNVLKDEKTGFLYWEALPTDPADRLLEAARANWQAALYEAAPQALEDLLQTPAGGGRRTVVLDQFEQLHPDQSHHQPIFDLLSRIAAEMTPPHHTTWLVAFREEYASVWWKFQNLHAFHPPMLPIERFSPTQAGAVIATLGVESGFELDQALVDAMVRDTSREKRVSPVDIGIGIGMMMLDGLARRRGAQHLTQED